MAEPVKAYPIDCAILLCLAGGFPASAECSAAKVEMIRRITPFPIEPPLQLWNCPMGGGAGGAAVAGLASFVPDGLTPEVRQYRDGIELYHIRHYSSRRNQDGSYSVQDITEAGTYDAGGDFHWSPASFEHGPAWLSGAVGGRREPVEQCVSTSSDGTCRRYETIGYTNVYGSEGIGGFTGTGSFTPSRLRGVAIRYLDYQGNEHAEFVSY
nr:hypothetical protein [Paracoccus aurantiacus]